VLRNHARFHGLSAPNEMIHSNLSELIMRLPVLISLTFVSYAQNDQVFCAAAYNSLFKFFDAKSVAL